MSEKSKPPPAIIQITPVNVNLHLADLFLVLFVGLKLSNFIYWEWLWVIFPFWGPPVCMFIWYYFKKTVWRPNKKEPDAKR